MLCIGAFQQLSPSPEWLFFRCPPKQLLLLLQVFTVTSPPQWGLLWPPSLRGRFPSASDFPVAPFCFFSFSTYHHQSYYFTFKFYRLFVFLPLSCIDNVCSTKALISALFSTVVLVPNNAWPQVIILNRYLLNERINPGGNYSNVLLQESGICRADLS